MLPKQKQLLAPLTSMVFLWSCSLFGVSMVFLWCWASVLHGRVLACGLTLSVSRSLLTNSYMRELIYARLEMLRAPELKHAPTLAKPLRVTVASL